MELNNITNTGTWGQQVTRLNDNFNKVALWIDTLQEMYESLSQSAIEVVDTLPSTGKANKIYRLVGTTSYSDYMYNTDDLNTPILMATYNNAIENEPTPGSNNLVKSGGIASNIVFDISAYHATGSTLATYADLTSALGTNGANVPSEVRKGGMSIKFVQTYDNKYVQYRLMSDEFTTDVTHWQGVDDEPTVGSDNLVKSGGIVSMYGKYVKDKKWIRVLVDKGGRFICGIDINGEVEWSAGVPTPVKNYIKDYNPSFFEKSNMYIYAIVDKNYKVIVGINKNGDVYCNGNVEVKGTIKSLEKYRKRSYNIGFTDFGIMPSCLSGEIGAFFEDGVDGNGEALVKYSDVITKYDALMVKYPNYITKTELGYDASGTIMMYSYTFTPKYYTQSVYLHAGCHGWEPDPVFGLCMIMHLIANSYNESDDIYQDMSSSCFPVLRMLRGMVKFTIIPVVNPWGFNNRQDCDYENKKEYLKRYSQNNYNNVQLNGNMIVPYAQMQPETQYVYDIFSSLKDELSFFQDMHSTVHIDSRERYGCFYAAIQMPSINNKTIYRTIEWLYEFYNEKYPNIVHGDTCPNPLGGGYASVGLDGKSMCYVAVNKFGIPSFNFEFSDHTWSERLHTSEAMSVCINQHLNTIIQQVLDEYKTLVDEVPQSDYYNAKG